VEEIDKSILNFSETRINLSEYFDKKFFYKGPKWKCEYPLKEISIIKNIEKRDEYLKIEIENITYPHSGYLILDIENYKIIESKRC
jgi:hypothetical protein